MFPPISLHCHCLFWRGMGIPWIAFIAQVCLTMPYHCIQYAKTIKDIQELQLWDIHEGLELYASAMIHDQADTLEYLLLDLEFRDAEIEGNLQLQSLSIITQYYNSTDTSHYWSSLDLTLCKSLKHIVLGLRFLEDCMLYPDFCWAILLRIVHSLPQSIIHFHLALQYYDGGIVALPQDEKEHAGSWKEIGNFCRMQTNFKKITISLCFSEYCFELQPSLVSMPQFVEAEFIDSGLSSEWRAY